MTLPIYRFVVASLNQDTPHAAALWQDAQVLGFTNITHIGCDDIYFIQGNLNQAELTRLGNELLHDPVTQSCVWQEQGVASVEQQTVQVVLRPGVTDPTAAAIAQNAKLLGIDTITNVTSGKYYHVQSPQPFH